MKVDLNRRDLIKLCKSTDIPYGGDNNILTEFCGNQWNEDWKWKDDAFNNMTEGELVSFYMKGGLKRMKPSRAEDCKFDPSEWSRKFNSKLYKGVG